ncbi:MAG TPA: hypothetical protein VKP64_15800 [Mycobacteriales bacterium]|nr:hypothetical protein [Mycobacteriales bacterium]
MRRRLAVAGVVVALVGLGTPTALATPTVRLKGTSASGYKNLKLPAGTVIDASAYRITTRDRYSFILGGGSDLTLKGATGVNTLPDSTSWKTFHGSAGVAFRTPRPRLLDGYFHNFGDSVVITRDAEGFVVRGNRFSNMHDDAWLENDWERNGLYEDNYADGLVGFSARPYLKGAATSAGLQRTLVIRNNVLWLKPMRSVHVGPKPGNGGVFKWRDPNGYGMRVAMTGNTIRLDKVGAWGSLTFPKSGGYENNVIVWTGRGPYPGKVPAGVRVLSGRVGLAHWVTVVADWERRHRR